MANLLINTTVGGNAVITTSNIGTYALTSLPSHNHDDRYFTETESDGRFQPLENQRVSTGNSPTFVDIYANEWFRNNNINEGLYNQATGTHFYSNGATSWAITGSGGNVQLEFRSNHQSTIRGFVYADTSNQIGFLNNAGDWSLRTNSSKDTQIYGALTVGSGTSADIYMTDTDETTRRIHTNSGRIGFLNAATNWGAYCDNTGNWFSDHSMRAPIFYDSADAAYYVDPNATTNIWRLQANDKYHYFGASSGWDTGSLNGANSSITNVHFQAHEDFWIGAGNTKWYTGVVSGHHDLLINTMQSGGNNVRGITFTASSGGASVYRLGRWFAHSTQVGSYLNVDGGIKIGGTTDTYSPPAAKLQVISSTSGSDVLAVDGVNGRLFTVTDDLSDSLFSVNTIAGLPVIEAFADNTVKIGKYGSNSITISGSKIAINSDTVDANFPFYVGDRSVAGARYSLTNKGMGFNLADNYAQLQLYGGNGSYIDFVTTSGQDSGGRIMWGSSFTISGDVYFNNPLYTYTLYDRNDTAYYLDMNGTSRLGTLNINQLSVYGNTYLGDGNGDEVHINDILRVGATDSGDAHFYFGEGGSAGSDYGSHWYWDSGYTFTWNTRNNGSDTAMFDYVTNDTTYINWRRNFHMQNREINYTAQLHFNGGTRFVTYNSNYLYFQPDSTSVGGILVRDGNSSIRGYSGYFDSNGFGLLNSSGGWGIRLNPGNVGTELFYAGDWRIRTRSDGAGVSGNLYTDQNYGHGLVGVYASDRYQGVFAMGDSYKLSADGTSSGSLYGIAWTHTNVGGQSKSGLGHQALFMANGSTQTAIGYGIWTIGLITTTDYGTSANWKSAYDWGNHASAGYQSASTAITTSNIGSQSVSYATTAGSLTSMNISQFTNNSGYLTSLPSHNHDDRYYTETESDNRYVPYGSITGSFGLNDNKLYLRTNNDNNHYIWNAADDWEEIVAYSGTGLRIASSTGVTLATFTTSGNSMNITGNAATATALTSMNISQFTNNSGYITGISFANVSSKPTTVAGYGITDAITTANIGSQSVSYAATAGSAPANGGNSSTVGGYSVSVGASANTIPTRNANGYLIPESWIQLNGIYGLYSPTNGAHLRPNDGSYGSWMMTGSRNSWQGIEFNSGSAGNISLMVATDSNTVGFHNNNYGWQFRWAGGTLYVYKNAYGAGTEATVLDSSNYSTWAQPIASAINTGNIGSQSVSYATTAGSADQIDGRGFVNTGSNNATYADSINSNGISYVAYNISLLGQTDGALYSQAYDSAWQHQIYGDYRTGQIVVRGKLNGTWQAWRTVIDSSTIGSQSVSYASSAGSVAWTNVSSRPTALSQFTNDLGNYGGFLTSITAHTHAISDVTGLQTALDSKQASLGFTPYNSTNPSGYITSSGSISGNAATATTASNLAADTSTRFKILTFTGVGGDSGNGAMPDSYAIYQQGGSWTHPYPDLCIGYHTGIKIGANSGYNGTRFYNDSNWATEIFSVGNGDNHVRVLNNLYVTGTVTGSNLSGTNTGDQTNISGNAATATNVAWTGVTSRPTALSQFSNDLGNYGGWITGINSGNVTTALGFTPYNATNPSGYITSSASISGNAATATNVAYSGLTGTVPTWNQNTTGNSATVGGYAVSGSVGANTVVIRDANNYIYAHYINSNVSETENPTINSFYTSNGDGWLRKSSVAHVKSQLGLGSMAYESSGTYQTVSGAINTGNIASQSVSYATISQQLTKFGDIYGQDWNSYFITGKLIVSNALGHTGTNRPSDSYGYGTVLSYGETGGPLMQMYFPEDVGNTGGAYRALAYRSGYNGGWSPWKTVVNQVGNTCTVAGSNGTGLQVHSNVGYNQNPLTYFLLRGQADSSWKTFKILLTGDAGGQDIEFRRIAENNTDARMFYVPRGLNQVIFDYTVVQPSDSRLKDNLTPITNPVDKIKSLRGVEFDWNSGEHVGTHDVGLIAQDVEAVLPEAVTTQEDGYKNLAYTKVIPLLVEAMKEQQTMIEALRAEVELLKNK